MKRQKQFMMLVFGTFLMLLSINSIAQNPTYLCKIQNAAQVSCNVYEFDVVMQRTGTTTLRLANFQFGINFTPGIRPKGAFMNVAMVPGSADALNPMMRPADIKFSADTLKNCIIVTPTPPQGWANSTIISNLAAGTKICRMRVACSQAWNTGIGTGHVWSFLMTSGYATKIFAYTGSTSPGVNTEITSTGTFSIAASPSGDVTLNNIGTPPIAQTVTSDITQVCLLPGNGATISLGNSESGYTYYLYKNGLPVTGAGSVAFGKTGSIISFGMLMTDGVITVKSPGCSGLVDMSNSITLTSLQPVRDSIYITATPGNSVTPGTSVTFNSQTFNGGTTPTFQWYVNGVPDYTNGMTSTYTYTPLNLDSIYCELISSETCVTPALATSNVIKMTVGIPPKPYNITGNTSYCQGTTGTPVGLDSTQVGVTYTLLKNNVAQTPTVAGTGSAITFGNQLAGTYKVRGTGPGGTSLMKDSLVITQTPSAPVSVSIVADQNNLCTPAPQVTFTATPVNGGTPTYQWYVGTTAVGSSSPTYAYTPANGQQVKVVMTSSGVQCATGSPATSNIITMVVNNSDTAKINITISPSNNICAGTTVNFSSVISNGGTTPIYQWYKNELPVGANSSSYSTNSLANNDSVYCMLTSNKVCVVGSPKKSNKIKMVVNTPLPVSVSVNASPTNDTVCLNNAVTYTAVPTNGGTSPVYQWYKNGSVVGTNSTTYTYPASAVATRDSIWVRLTSSLGCVSGNPALSSKMKITVKPLLPVSVSVVASNTHDTVCLNTAVTYTATPTNGGTLPVYEWYKNSVVVGTNANTYTYPSSSITTDTIWVKLTSSLSGGCVTGNPATSVKKILMVSPCTGIETNSLEISSIIVYPNPTNDKLYINFNDVKEVPQSMRIYNSLGQVSFISETPMLISQGGIDVSNYSAGTYTIQIVFEKGLVNKTFIVE